MHGADAGGWTRAAGPAIAARPKRRSRLLLRIVPLLAAAALAAGPLAPAAWAHPPSDGVADWPGAPGFGDARAGGSADVLGARNAVGALDDPNPIVVENRKPGTDAWRLGRPGYRTASDVGSQIKGYASATSVDQGDPISFHVTVAPRQSYTIAIYRLGWYGGRGGRLMTQTRALSGRVQSPCPRDLWTGLIACRWTAGYTLTVPGTWTSGIYLALLTNSQRYQNYVPFVVRDDDRPSALLYQQPVSTYQAYNGYPNDGRTGKSLYDTRSAGGRTLTGTIRAVKVSFDRPYANDGAGDLFRFHEYYAVRWLERSGYDLTYSTSIDTHARPTDLLLRRGFVSAGHDEYWSREMYDAAETARNAGVSLAFLSANNVYWQVRYERSATGVPNRILVCYKNARFDPVADPSLETIRWRERPVTRPEQSLLGVQFIAGLDRSFAYRVRAATHWIHDGTGFRDGDTVAYGVGGEADSYQASAPAPRNLSHTLLSDSAIVDKNGVRHRAHSSIYQAPSGAWVFAAGTFRWSALLGYPGTANARIQRMTANLLDRFVAIGPLATH